MKHVRFTPEEIAFFKDYPQVGAAGLSPHLPGRTLESIRNKARELGYRMPCKRPDEWQPWEEELLKANFISHGRDWCSKHLARTPEAVYRRYVHKFGTPVTCKKTAKPIVDDVFEAPITKRHVPAGQWSLDRPVAPSSVFSLGGAA